MSVFSTTVHLIKVIVARRRNPNGLPLPPGPKGYHIIGNLFDVPAEKPWLAYNEWAKFYGDIIYFEVLGQPFLVLNSLERIQDLFEKRSSNYSDRMRMPMVLELMNWGYNLAMLPYGTWWRRHRRTFNDHFHPNIVWKYQPAQAREVRAFLNRLLATPENFMHHIRHTFAATIMSIAYGIRVKDSDDPYISNAEEALYGLAEAGIPGTFLVDFIPLLKYVPEWFPGATFKRKAARWRRVNNDVAEKPFKYVQEQMKKGIAVPCLASTLIERLPDENDPLRAEETKIAQNISAVTYVAGADTTVSAVQCFFLAMAMYPEVQKKAQAEIDAVTGPNRLPEFSDRPSLPYINALVKESMRWQSIIPLAVGHMASEDDEYDGYFIPKGTVVLGNGWAILHDPTIFKDPLEYQPERYLKDGQLDPNVRNPDTGAFGFGRRMCPGRHMSDNSLYAIVSSVLAVYNITPPLDANGTPIKLTAEVTSGLLSYPVPFKCVIKPRNPGAEALIRDCVMTDH
ncbi:cytochrome P450 [Flammula alnicola]|nr:cytochrome P450 [Flammula alnicola]